MSTGRRKKSLFFEAKTQRSTRQSMSTAQECPYRPYGACRTIVESPEGPRTRKFYFRAPGDLYLRGGMSHPPTGRPAPPSQKSATNCFEIDFWKINFDRIPQIPKKNLFESVWILRFSNLISWALNLLHEDLFCSIFVHYNSIIWYT